MSHGADQPPRVLHLVPHTHWDREWYEPFQRFRLRLVDLVDRVLERAEADRRFCFTFDGQTAMLEDYLEIRPGAEPRIRALVATGQLAVGPWRILSDEFLVSGETLVRNLEAGLSWAERFGQVMAVGYLPDEFGHAAQIPQLLRLAGFGHAAVWRGVPAAVDRHAFSWSAPDGSSVRTEYLVDGYGNAAGLFAYPDVAVAGRRLLERLEPYFGTDPVLAMCGTDHSSPVPDLLEVVEELNRSQDRYRVRLGTLADYVLEEATADGDDLPRWQGELRSSARANILMGVLSARIGLKVACARAERLLARYAEPLQALHGTGWPGPFLELAWRRLVESSGHDSITGCGADAVAEHVAVRLGEAAQLGSGLAERVAAEVAGRVPVGAVVVLNPSPFARAGLVDLDLAVPDAWDEIGLELPDGRLVATQELGRSPAVVHTEAVAGSRLGELFRRVHGRKLYNRVINGIRVERDGGGHRLVFELDDHPDPPHLDMDELRAQVDAAAGAAPEASWEVRVVAPPRRRLQAAVPVPALGWTAVAASPGRGALVAPVTLGRPDPDLTPGPVAAGAGRLDNGLVSVEVAGDGTLRVRAGQLELAGVGRLVDGGDAGDLYNYAPPAQDLLVSEPEGVEVTTVASGPVRGELAVRRSYRWPAGLEPAGSARSAERAAAHTVIHVQLRAGEPFLRLRVVVDNPCRDHRLRLHVPLAAPTERSFAEGQFAVVERGISAEGGHGEVPLPTFPAAGFVDAGGVAVLLDHVTEYELLADPPELALTLLRSVGQISRDIHRYREEPAGPQTPTPGAQCLGIGATDLAIYPHQGTWHEDGVLTFMECFGHDLLAAPGSGPPGRRGGPATVRGLGGGGLTVEGAGVTLSSLRRRGDWLELRLACQHPFPATATVDGGVVAARAADLLGRPGPGLPVAGGTLRLHLRAWEVRTVQLRVGQVSAPGSRAREEP
ncbi:MAG TPA: glycoside hydrolase family 38 C-terminal domain-containing protein [Actinomycetota bacterium]|jgi:alpha-mannosidase|nr:glycoside hydrolase family 38 C-terminal domain-containing protein [Actinomycetota bacterium]